MNLTSFPSMSCSSDSDRSFLKSAVSRKSLRISKSYLSVINQGGYGNVKQVPALFRKKTPSNSCAICAAA